MPSSSMRIIDSSSTTRTRLPASARVRPSSRPPISAPLASIVMRLSRARHAYLMLIPLLADSSSAEHEVNAAVDRSVGSSYRPAGIALKDFEARSPWPRFQQPMSSAWSSSWRCAGAASAIRRCCAPWTRCRASISSTPAFADNAYADQALPIACGQTISQPYVVAYMTEQLEVAAAAPRARNRHRLGLSGRGAVAAGARGGEHRALPHARRRRARPPQDARL